RPRPARDADGGRRQHPRGDRVPEDADGKLPDDRRAEPGGSAAAPRGRHPPAHDVVASEKWCQTPIFGKLVSDTYFSVAPEDLGEGCDELGDGGGCDAILALVNGRLSVAACAQHERFDPLVGRL